MSSNESLFPAVFMVNPSRKIVFDYVVANIHSHESAMTLKEMIKGVGLSERTILVCLKELESLAMIKRRRVGKFTRYEVLDQKMWKTFV